MHPTETKASSQSEVPRVIDIPFDASRFTERAVGFLRERMPPGLPNVVLGLSGGVDSAVAATLAARALGPDHVHVALLPFDAAGYGKQSVDDARLVIAHLQLPRDNVHLVDIAPIVNTVTSRDPAIDPVRRGNVMARVRMIELFDLAKALHAVVLGTENKTEHLLGYFTRGGDELSDIELLRGLYKTQVWQLATFLKLPKVVIEKKPSADLWTGQTDEGEFGFSYAVADQILHLSVDLGKTPSEIVPMGFPKTVVDAVLTRLSANAFKHQVPYVLD